MLWKALWIRCESPPKALSNWADQRIAQIKGSSRMPRRYKKISKFSMLTEPADCTAEFMSSLFMIKIALRRSAAKTVVKSPKACSTRTLII